MAQIVTRKRGNVWEYRFEKASINGKRQQACKGGYRTKMEALRAGNEALTEYNNCGTDFIPSEMSYSDYLDYWMEKYCENELNPVTCESYAKRIRLYIKPALGSYRLNSLTSDVLQTFLIEKSKEGFSRNSLITWKGILTGSLNYAVHSLNFLKTNPAQNIKIPSNRGYFQKEDEKSTRIYITPEQMKKILERFPYGSSGYLPILFAYRCGLRLGEVYGLFWSDIDFTNETLHVQRQVQYINGKITFTPPKYNSTRKIKLDFYLLDILKKVREEQLQNKNDYKDEYTTYYESAKRVLISQKEEGAQQIELVHIRENGSYFQPRTEKHVARVIHYELEMPKYNFHSLRHTHATMLAEHGALPKDIQNRLGHKNIAVTMEIYVHLTGKMENISLEILEKIPILE